MQHGCAIDHKRAIYMVTCSRPKNQKGNIMSNVLDLTMMSPAILDVDGNPISSDVRTRNVIKVAVPTLNDILLNKPQTPTYRDGERKEVTHYGNKITTNSFGTKELKDYNGSVEDLIHDIGADFRVKPHKLMYQNPNSGELMEMPNYYLFNENTGNLLNNNPVSERYSVLDFADCIRYFYALVEEIRSHGYDVRPDVARVWDNGNKMFLQYSVDGNEIMGEPYKTNLTMLTSHDKKWTFMIALSQIRLFCKNCVSKLLKNCDSQLRIRHTKIAKNAIEAESYRVLAAADTQHKVLGDYLQSLATIKVNEQQIYDTWMTMNGINTNELIPAASASKLQTRLGEYFACLDADDVANFKGTALGAYYAFTDFNDHVVPARTTKGIGDSKIEDALYNGNPAVSKFIDTLVEVAK